MGARFSAPVQTGPGAPPSLLYNGYRVFPGGKAAGAWRLTPHPLLVPWSRKGRAIPQLLLWAVWLVQGLSACTRVTFIIYLYYTFLSSEEALEIPPCWLNSFVYSMFLMVLQLPLSCSMHTSGWSHFSLSQTLKMEVENVSKTLLFTHKT